MRKSTIKLTKHELDFASDTIYPQTKQSVIGKMQLLFAECAQQLQLLEDCQKLNLPANYKITRGENYRQLPYVVLDYPALKGRDFELVMRTMFWWGKYVSCNLIVHTANIHPHYRSIENLTDSLILTGDNLWEQDLDSPAFSNIHKLSVPELEECIQARTYLKISHKIPLSQLELLPDAAAEVYTRWLSVLNIKKGAY